MFRVPALAQDIYIYLLVSAVNIDFPSCALSCFLQNALSDFSVLCAVFITPWRANTSTTPPILSSLMTRLRTMTMRYQTPPMSMSTLKWMCSSKLIRHVHMAIGYEPAAIHRHPENCLVIESEQQMHLLYMM